MVKNIIEDVITPDVPKVLPKDQLHVYVPVAGPGKPGIAGYNEEDFDVAEGNVSLKPSLKQTILDADNLSKENALAISALEEHNEMQDSTIEAHGKDLIAIRAIMNAKDALVAEHSEILEEHTTELERLDDLKAYDFVVTTEEEFANISRMQGRILVNNVTLKNMHTLTLPPTVRDIHVTSLFVESVVSLTATASFCSFNCDTVCRVSGKLTLTGFTGIHGVINDAKAQGGIHLVSCSDISGSEFETASKCSFISDCTFYSENMVTISNCRHIHGVYVTDPVATDIAFESCSFISNVDASGTYNNCKYVDEATCKGYVPSADDGKVRMFKSDGTYSSGALVAKISLDIDNEYRVTATLKDSLGNVIASSNVIDLPVEELVTEVLYDEDKDVIVIRLKSGSYTEIPASAIISGLATEDWVIQKLEEYTEGFDELIRKLVDEGVLGDLQATLAHVISLEETYLGISTTQLDAILATTEEYIGGADGTS